MISNTHILPMLKLLNVKKNLQLFFLYIIN